MHAGHSLLAPEVTGQLIRTYVQAARPPQRHPQRGAAPAGVTNREREVLSLVARGLSNAEIAGRLYVAETTVKTHVSSLLTKLGLRDRVHAAVYAHRAGLVDPEVPGGAGPPHGG